MQSTFDIYNKMYKTTHILMQSTLDMYTKMYETTPCIFLYLKHHLHMVIYNLHLRKVTFQLKHWRYRTSDNR